MAFTKQSGSKVHQRRRGKNLTTLQILERGIKSKRLRMELNKLESTNYIDFVIQVEKLKLLKENILVMN